MNCGFGGKIKTQSFQKLFSGGHHFVFVEYLCKRIPKIKTKNIKNYSSILAIVNHWNWLDDSPPLSLKSTLLTFLFLLLTVQVVTYTIVKADSKKKLEPRESKFENTVEPRLPEHLWDRHQAVTLAGWLCWRILLWRF